MPVHPRSNKIIPDYRRSLKNMPDDWIPVPDVPEDWVSIRDKLKEHLFDGDTVGIRKEITKRSPNPRAGLADLEKEIARCTCNFYPDAMFASLDYDANIWRQLLRAELEKETPSLSVILFCSVGFGGCLQLLEMDVAWIQHFYSRGQAVYLGGKKGHELVYGSPEAKQERWRQYQSKVDALLSESPKRGYMSVCDEVAKHCGVSSKTIRRHTTNPKARADSPPAVQ